MARVLGTHTGMTEVPESSYGWMYHVSTCQHVEYNFNSVSFLTKAKSISYIGVKIRIVLG